MAREIPGLKIGQLKNATHFEMMTDVEAQANACPGITQYAPQALAAFSQAVAKEGEANQESQKSQYTSQITQKDTERDAALIAAKDALRAACGNPDEATRTAALFLKEMSKLLKTKVVPQYDQQTGEVTIVCDELLGKYAEQTLASGIKPYIEQLKRLNDEMCDLLVLRDTERGEQGKSKVAEARTATDEAYRELIRQVNALQLVYSLGQLTGAPAQDPFAEFVSFMLGIIDRYKHEILHTSGTKPAESEEVEEEVTEEEKEETETPGAGGGDQTPGGSEGDQTGGSGSGSGSGTGGSGSNTGGSGSGSGNNPGSGSGTGSGSNPGSGSGTGIPIQPGPGGDDPDL